MILNTKNFSTLVQNQAAAIQGRASALVDFSVGSILRAVVEANAGVALWLQGLGVYILSITRAATSTGIDLDTWVNDYGLTRLGAQSSLGTVTFARFSPGAQAVIPIGAIVKTADGTQSFQVVIDTANTSYNAGLAGYVLPAGASSIDVPVQAVTPGSVGNVLAQTVALIASSIPFVDTVTNAAAFAGGGDAESDAALRLRFTQFIASLSKATPLAIKYAVASLRLGIDCAIVENYDYSGAWRPGYFYVVVDDGSGAPPSSLLSLAHDAIENTRAATVLFDVFAPILMLVNPIMTISVAQGYDANVVKGAVGTALRGYINALKLGDGLPYSKLSQLAYEASPGVTNVVGVTLNGGTSDIVGNAKNLLRPGIMAVN